jgi:hypothetical protein
MQLTSRPYKRASNCDSSSFKLTLRQRQHGISHVFELNVSVLHLLIVIK